MVSLISVPLFAAGLVSFLFFISFYILSQYSKNKHYYRSFSFLSLYNAIFLFSFGVLANASNNLELLNITNRIVIISAMLTVTASIYFIREFFSKSIVPIADDNYLKSVCIVNALFVLLCVIPSPWFLEKAFYPTNNYYTALKYGPLFQLWLMYIFLLLCYGFYLAFCEYKKHCNASKSPLSFYLLLLVSYGIWTFGGIVDILSSQRILESPPISWLGSIMVVFAIELIVSMESVELNWKLQNETVNHQKTTEALKDSENRFLLAAQGANDGLWDWDLKTNEVYFSPRWKTLLGYQDSEIGNTPDDWYRLIYKDDIEMVKCSVDAHLKGVNSFFQTEFRILHRDDVYRWVSCRGMGIMDEAGNYYRMAGSITDINDKKRHEQQILHDAFHDHLTGLPNRNLFMDRLDQAFKHKAHFHDYYFAVVHLDIDRFKIINDNLGHAWGDQLLISISKRFLKCIKDADTVARFGGDEFTFLININDLDSGHKIPDKIAKTLSEPFLINDTEIYLTASVGIVIGPAEYTMPDQILRDTDIAMYSAKHKGGGQHQIFNIDMHAHAKKRLELENDLRAAIVNDELEAVYQPIVSLDDGQVKSFEALVRWNKRDNEVISPAVFIPIMEETGLIIELDRWILIQSCKQIIKWREQQHVAQECSISVNFSGLQFSSKHLADEIKQMLDQEGIPLDVLAKIRIEITETVLMENPEAATVILDELHKLNLQLSLDDFGTGYSSLSYIQRFPADVVKIDQSFVKNICTDNSSAEIVQVMIMLGHNLHMKVIAEGVENKEQVAYLKQWDCEYGQGYFFSKALNSKDAEQVVIAPQWIKVINQD